MSISKIHSTKLWQFEADGLLVTIKADETAPLHINPLIIMNTGSGGMGGTISITLATLSAIVYEAKRLQEENK